jgi:hypothetical protein
MTTEYAAWTTDRNARFWADPKFGGWYELLEEPLNYDKDLDYQHGALHNEPATNQDMMSVLGWQGWNITATHKASAADLIGHKTVSLDALGYEVEDEYTGEATTVDWQDVLEEVREDHTCETPVSCDLEWVKSNTKPEQYEALMLWAMGKSWSDAAVVLDTDRIGAKRKTEKTMARLQKRLHSAIK